RRRPMKRVLLVGSGGSGKSTLARRLGARLGLEVIHLDKLYWLPGWVEPPKEVWEKKVEELCARRAWVMDGNYSGTLEQRLAACDTAVFLDLPRALCLWRVLKRAVLYRRGGRPDVAEGCPESFNLEFFLWVWNYPERSRPKVLKLLEKHAHEKRIVRLRSRAEVEKFLAQLEEGPAV
ncbi:MAG TPA: DNA topology modulation protein, partial [Pyrinomonadaceae bacterium]